MPSLLPLPALVAALACAACAELECGVGTHEEQGQCLPNVPVACGPGTVYERGYCVIDGEVASAPETADDAGDADAAPGPGAGGR